MMSRMETKCPQQQLGCVSPLLNVQCCLNDKQKANMTNFPTAPPHWFWHHGNRAIIVEMQNQTEERKYHILFFLANMLADDAPRVVQNNAIKPISMTCHDNQSFFTSDVKCALQLVYCWYEIQSRIKSNQTSEAKSLWFSSGALPLGYLLYLMKDENHRCVERLSKSGKRPWRTAAERWREVQGIHNDTWLVVILVFSDGLTHLSSDSHPGLLFQKP